MLETLSRHLVLTKPWSPPPVDAQSTALSPPHRTRHRKGSTLTTIAVRSRLSVTRTVTCPILPSLAPPSNLVTAHQPPKTFINPMSPSVTHQCTSELGNVLVSPLLKKEPQGPGVDQSV